MDEMRLTMDPELREVIVDPLKEARRQAIEVLQPLLRAAEGPEIGVKKIRYVFTVVMPPVLLPDNPMAQQIWIRERVSALEALFPSARIGFVAAMEVGDGTP